MTSSEIGYAQLSVRDLTRGTFLVDVALSEPFFLFNFLSYSDVRLEPALHDLSNGLHCRQPVALDFLAPPS